MRTLAMLCGLTLLAATQVSGEDLKPVPPPPGAKLLLDGKDLAGWSSRSGGPPRWKATEDGYVECVPRTGDIMTTEKFGPDFHLHVEFWLPLMKDAKDQGKSNSGVYLQGRYEIQVLDSYKNATYANGSVGALYGILAPDEKAQSKAVKPPEEWNAYDIYFRAPRVDEAGKVVQKGEVTVVLNGVTLIDKGKFDRTTGGALDQKLGEPGPILLQDHGNHVRYRNIWLRPLSASD